MNDNPNNLKNHKQNYKQNYQISGIEPNYSYGGEQNLPFDQSSISTTGFKTTNDLNKAVEQQKQFVSKYNDYKPLDTFGNSELYNLSNSSNSSNYPNLENMRNYSQYGIEKNFEPNKPIMFMPDTKNKHETLYDNLNDNLLKESLKEYRLNIDSIDRDIRIYPDPFNYIVQLGPVTNSGINSVVVRNNLKMDLKTELKNSKKKHLDIKKKYLEQEEKRYQKIASDNSNNIESQDLTDAVQSEIFIFDSPEAIKEYTVNLERSFNPYIIRNFNNINYIKLDCVVIPKYTSICINENWDYCRKHHHKKKLFRDEFERIKDYIILNDRYIPNEKNEYNPLGDRFIQIFIKELQSTRNFGTNPITDKSFLLIFDKTLGALYLKLIPYSATKIYKESLLGNLNKLSIQFFDSWGKPLKINTECIDYEINQLANTDLIDPNHFDISCCFETNNYSNIKIKKIIKFYTEIIKCFVVINYDINQLIPFYTSLNNLSNNLSNDLSNNLSNDTKKINFHTNCLDFKTIQLNEKIFSIPNIYVEFNDFVGSSGFEDIIKISNGNKKIKLSIDEYINNVVWFDLDFKNLKNLDNILNNIKAFENNYKNFGFEILDILKKEIVNIPINKNFQNFLTFLLGIWEDELNTKIDYYK